MSKPGVGGAQVFPIRATLITTDATPTAGYSLSLVNDQTVCMQVEAIGRGPNSTQVAEFRARNVFTRTAAGVSSRVGAAGGIQDSVGNSFAAPRPSVTFGDPSVSNVATFVVTGKAATTIHWNLEITLTRGAG